MKDTNDFINFIKTRKFQTMWSWPYMTLVLSTPTFLKKKELTLSAAITKITMTRKYLSRFKVIPLKLFYYQTFFETWRNEHP